MSSSESTPRQPQRLTAREQIPAARRIVIKIGSSSLTDAQGRLDEQRIQRVAALTAQLVQGGAQVLIVSSGAIAAALGELGLTQRPTTVPLQQAAASIGQVALASAWQRAFAAQSLLTGQVLLTDMDMVRRDTYGNVREALEALLSLGTVPVINENDTTATHEIRFGDNDRLAALLAQVTGADLLVLLTDVDSLRTAPPQEPGSERIAQVDDVSRLAGVSIGAVGSRVGTGGMVTKLAAVDLAAVTGTASILASADAMEDALRGEDVGTFFPAQHGRRRSRLVWLRFATRGAGTIHVDEGAAMALRTRRRSLLAVGITAVSGTFPAGVPVDVAGPDGELIVRGLVAFNSEELAGMRGMDTAQLREQLGSRFARPVVHRDHLVMLTRPVG